MKISGILKVVAKYKYLIAVVGVGLLLLVFPGKGTDVKKDADIERAEFDVRAFEKQIEKALSSCYGVGRAEVMLSVNAGYENVYAKETKQSLREQEKGVVRESDSDFKTSIMSEGSGRESPIVIKEIYPEFRGAVVICDGAGDISVRSNVTELVSALTGLKSDRISVIKMKRTGD